MGTGEVSLAGPGVQDRQSEWGPETGSGATRSGGGWWTRSLRPHPVGGRQMGDSREDKDGPDQSLPGFVPRERAQHTRRDRAATRAPLDCIWGFSCQVGMGEVTADSLLGALGELPWPWAAKEVASLSHTRISVLALASIELGLKEGAGVTFLKQETNGGAVGLVT